MADDTRGDDASRGLVAGWRRTYANMPRTQRLLIGGVALAVLVGLLAIVFTSTGKPEMQPLAHGMTGEDIEAATKALDAKKIPYQMTDDGTLAVPTAQIHEARLALAVSTMPSGKVVGFELFDGNAMGRSSFAEKIDYHRALEGELARTIRHIEGIDSARVHLVIPERRVVRDMDTEASASVVVSLKAGVALSPRQTQAIRQLVAGAVERLAPGQVVIIDQHGVMLARPDQPGIVGGGGLDRELETEQALEQSVVRLLEPVVGAGKVIARVAVSYDFSSVVETKEMYDPEKQVVRSEREQIERNSNDQQLQAGAPGTASNLPTSPGQPSTTTTGRDREKTDTVRNYELDKTVVRREQPLPRVQRMTVAVLVDDGPHAHTPAEITQYSTLVSRALGLDKTRGDDIEVVSTRFAAPDGTVPGTTGADTGASGTAGGANGDEGANDIIMYAAIGGGAVVLIAALLFMRSRKKAAKRRAAVAAAAARDAMLAAPRPVASKGMVEQTEPLTIEERRARITALRNRALELGGEDLPRVAAVFERWFEEERRANALAGPQSHSHSGNTREAA